MVENYVKKRIKEQLETMGERTGKRIGQAVSKNADTKAGEVGRKLGKTVAEQVERLHDTLEKETVTKQEELGLGGKIGTGLGIIGKNLVEKRYGILGKLAGSGDLVSEGRTMGAKAQKIAKRAVRTGVERLVRAGRRADKAPPKKPPTD
jgi:hypothetical protein